MSQSRVGSFVEAVLNLLLGFGINFVANILILPAFGFTSLTLWTNFKLGLVYTVVSLCRQYAIRRWVNHLIHNAADGIAGGLRKWVT